MKTGFEILRAATGFSGVNQAAAGQSPGEGESPDAVNGRTDGGLLSTAPGYAPYIGTPLPAPPVTPMIFYRYDADGSITRYLLAATDDDLYSWSGSAWVSIKGAETLTHGRFAYANYRERGVSKIILSNGVDPVYAWTGDGNITRLTAADEEFEAPRGNSLAIHVQRLWVTGAADSPDTVFASDAYAPSNWETGEYDAGSITLSAWDGGRIVGLAPLLGDLAVFRRKSVFRIVGQYPGNFETLEVLATEGAVSPHTLCQYNNRAYFLSDDGIMVYDTQKAYELLPDALREFWAGVNREALSGACGIVHNRKLYMAVPYGAGQTANNRVIEYDFVRETLMIRSGLTVSRFAEDDETLLFTGPGNYVYAYGDAQGYDGGAVDLTWDTPRSDWGHRERKFVHGVTLWGWTDTAGGQAQVSLWADGSWSEPVRAALPAALGRAEYPVRGNGRVLGLRLQNVGGSVIHIASADVKMEIMEDW